MKCQRVLILALCLVLLLYERQNSHDRAEVICNSDSVIMIMAALCNTGPLYFCPVVSFFRLLLLLLLLLFFLLLLLLLLLSSSFFPRLISAAVDRMSAILLHMAWP